MENLKAMLDLELCGRVFGESFNWVNEEDLPCDAAFNYEGQFFMLVFAKEMIASSLKAYHDAEQDYLQAFGVEVLRVGNRLHVVSNQDSKRTLLAIRKALRYVL